MGLLDRLRRRTSRAPRRSLPATGVLRRERRSVIHAREEKLRDLGGLMLEMYRRDRFREDLLAERCRELLGLDARLRELDELLAAARGRVPVARCECGAPLPRTSHFCAHCGRPAGDTLIACVECGHPLPADGRFCVACGAPAADLDGGEAAAPAAENPPESEEAPAVPEDTQDHVPVEEAGGAA